MKKFGLIMMTSAALGLSACGQDEAAGEEEIQASENAVAAQPGELGTVEGSYDVAGEGPVNADADATAANSGEAR